MAKKSTKAWPAVRQFLSEKSTDNFLEILVPISKGNLAEADRKRLGEIAQSDLVLSDTHFPEFEKKFVDRLIDLRFDIDFEKLDRFLEAKNKELEKEPKEESAEKVEAKKFSPELVEAITKSMQAEAKQQEDKEELIEVTFSIIQMVVIANAQELSSQYNPVVQKVEPFQVFDNLY